MKRKGTYKRKDKSVFKKTAQATKKINVTPKISRGGIKL